MPMTLLEPALCRELTVRAEFPAA